MAIIWRYVRVQRINVVNILHLSKYFPYLKISYNPIILRILISSKRYQRPFNNIGTDIYTWFQFLEFNIYKIRYKYDSYTTNTKV